jgi:hypothetical protein
MIAQVITMARNKVVKIPLILLIMITSSACANKKMWAAPPILAQSATIALAS